MLYVVGEVSALAGAKKRVALATRRNTQRNLLGSQDR
jgi:hypothetical protein